jgi:hypothetical protein
MRNEAIENIVSESIDGTDSIGTLSKIKCLKPKGNQQHMDPKTKTSTARKYD